MSEQTIIGRATQDAEKKYLNDSTFHTLVDSLIVAVKNNIPATVLPGPTALIAALVLSGFSTDRFIFEGFLPKKDGPRKRRLQWLLSIGCTIIIYESPHRLLRLLKNLQELESTRQISCVREISKKFEEIKRDVPGKLISHFVSCAPCGEFVVIIAPKDKDSFRGLKTHRPE